MDILELAERAISACEELGIAVVDEETYNDCIERLRYEGTQDAMKLLNLQSEVLGKYIDELETAKYRITHYGGEYPTEGPKEYAEGYIEDLLNELASNVGRVKDALFFKI